MRRAVFLDRDGVINKKAPPHRYILNWKEFEFLPYVAEAIADLNQRNFLVVVVSNQRGIARGMLSVEKLEEIHSRMLRALFRLGAKVDGVYYCPHDYCDNCNCRKPKPGMLLEAASDLGIDLSRSFMVGDSEDDILAGNSAGCSTVLVLTGETKDIAETVRWQMKPDHIISRLDELRGVVC